tara:strand:+ start:1787 stop:5035 length:3249 start_codon:yes stop_codon:yes gene_type:complete
LSNRIQILNATADDFALEIISSAPANGSVGDHANGRLVKYGTHIYVWCDHQGIWAKFANVSDFTSLETRLSQQEDANDTDVLSLEAVDTSLETRTSEEESAMLSAVASEEARASAQEDSIETRISSMISEREEDVSSEASFQESLVTSVSTGTSTIISARISAVDSLEARASAAETSLESRLSTEEDTRGAADLSIQVRLASEEANRASEDASVASDIASASSNRISADTSIETRLSNEEDRVDAILAASTADKDSFAEVVSFINEIDLSHDTQTSTEISTLASDIASMESSLGAVDTSLETRLSNEEDTRSSDDTSLETRLSEEEDAMIADAVSLTTRKSAEESTRLAADNSLGGRIGVNEAARANADTSIETRLSNEEDSMTAGDLSLETLLSGDSSDRGTSDSSIETGMSEEESVMLSAVASEETTRINADISLELLASTEEVARASADTSLETRVSDEEGAMASTDSSLELRLSAEESSEVVDNDSLELRLSNEEVARATGESSVETRFSNEISTEKSRIDEILDSADADKDTFVELVSFITEFDVDADDVLASYQLVIDSRISAEESNVLVGDTSIESGLSSKIVERQSIIASLETKHSGEISTVASSIDSIETREESRHLRIDFTSKTTFTVLQSDLPSGFTPGNGMVQVFQEVSGNKYRRLVAPMNFDPTTGEMTFNLGTTQKSGFAVFYSHTGANTLTQSFSTPGDNTGSSTSSFAAHKITDATLILGAGVGDTTSVVFDVSGVTASNINDYLNYDALYYVNSSYGSQNTYSSTINRTWNSDYSQFTISWTNAQAPAAYSSGYYFQFFWGGSNSETSFMSINLYFDATTHELNQTSGALGEYLTNNPEGFPINPPYMSGSGTATYDSNRNWAFFGSGGRRKYNYGPQWIFDLENYPGLSQNLRNYIYLVGAGYNNNGDSIFPIGSTACQFTRNGIDYYAAPSVSSSHPVYSEITSGRTAAQLNRVTAVMWYSDLRIGWWNKSSGSNTNSLTPYPDTTVTFYVLNSSVSNKLITDDASSSNNYSNWAGNTSYATDIKIVVDTTDQSYDIYRNSNVGGTPTWVAVDRAYLSNQEVS